MMAIFELPRELINRLKTRALDHNISVSDLVHKLLEQGLDNEEAPKFKDYPSFILSKNAIVTEAELQQIID